MKLTALAAILALGLSAPENTFEQKLKEARFTLSEAVEKAGKDLKHATPMAARLKQVKETCFWDVRFAQGDKSLRLAVDAKSAELLEKKDLKGNLASTVAASKLTFAKGIEIALQKVAGKPVSARIELENGKPVMEVTIFKDGKLFEVEVDAVSGAVLEVEEDDDEDKDDDDDDEDSDE